MSAILALLSKLLPFLPNIFGRLGQMNDKKEELAHEREMERMKRYKGWPTPRMLAVYFGLALMAVYLFWLVLGAFYPEWWPPCPFSLEQVSTFLGALILLGG